MPSGDALGSNERRSSLIVCCAIYALAAVVASMIVAPAYGHEPTEACHTTVELPSLHLVSRHCQTLQPHRIVIVRTKNRQDRLKEQDLFAHALASHLSASPSFSVVIGRERVCQELLPMRCGTFDELQLLQLAKTYNADCVLFCELVQLSAYRPMQAEMSMLLVHVPESVALVSVKERYDLGDPSTRTAYLTTKQGANENLTVDVVEHSPRQFIDFAAQRFSAGILSVW